MEKCSQRFGGVGPMGGGTTEYRPLRGRVVLKGADKWGKEEEVLWKTDVA